MKYKLKIDENLEMLVQPMSVHEREQLKTTLHTKNSSAPIRVWNMTVLIDYDLYELYQSYQSDFTLQRIAVNNMEEAIIWICKNQIVRKDLTDEMYRYLVGKRYLAELLLGMHNSAVKNDNLSEFGESEYDGQIGNTSFRLGAEYRVHPDTIKRYGAYAKMIDKINFASHETARKILRGTIKISHDNLSKIIKFSDNDLQNLINTLESESREKIKYMNSNEIISRQNISPDKKDTFIHVCSVKNIPDFDPDAEISSLTLTIPSWISSINRVLNDSDMTIVSTPAKEKLEQMLCKLLNTVQNTLSAVKENKNGRL